MMVDRRISQLGVPREAYSCIWQATTGPTHSVMRVTLPTQRFMRKRCGSRLQQRDTAYALEALLLRRFLRLKLLPYATATEQCLNGDGWLSSLMQPTQHPFLLQLRQTRLFQGIENPENFQESPIARLPGIRCHNTVERSFVSSCPCESQMNSHSIPPSIHTSVLMVLATYLERIICASCLRPPDPAIAFAIFLADKNCLINRFTSSTLVPLPRAIRFFLLPLMSV